MSKHKPHGRVLNPLFTLSKSSKMREHHFSNKVWLHAHKHAHAHTHLYKSIPTENPVGLTLLSVLKCSLSRASEHHWILFCGLAAPQASWAGSGGCTLEWSQGISANVLVITELLLLVCFPANCLSVFQVRCHNTILHNGDLRYWINMV